MKLPEHYDSDVLFFFDGRPLELSLYEALFRHMDSPAYCGVQDCSGFD